MKTKLTINNNAFLRRVAVFLSLLIAHCSLLIVLSCEQPFKAGLGPVVDLRQPTIELLSPASGAYLRDEKEFNGVAEDDIKLESVWFQLANYPDKILPGYRTMKYTIKGKTEKEDEKDVIFHQIKFITGTDREIEWKFYIDTTEFPDGDFMIRLLAIDSATKFFVTDKIAFFIKNNIPQITMSAPSIVQGQLDGDLGSVRLNYGYLTRPPQGAVFQRIRDTESLMVGMISDSEGLVDDDYIKWINQSDEYDLLDDDDKPIIDQETGEPAKGKLFPPQIRFWQVNVSGTANDNDDDRYKVLSPGVYPSETPGDPLYVPWEPLDVIAIGAKDLQFTYQLPKKSGTYYGFEIRAQSRDKRKSTALYPSDYINFDGKSDDFKRENRYVLILVREPLEYPTLELYRLEDIYNPNPPNYGWNPSKGENGGYNDIEGLNKDVNYPYVDSPIVSKNGPFTLRMKASHTGGISTVNVFWEKDDDKSIRGRFIWDPVDKEAYPGWKGGIVSGTLPFNTWGRTDPNIGFTVRSFVFTYTDNPANDIIPNEPGRFYDGIAGRSKVQRYTGDLSFDELERLVEDEPGKWADYPTLPDGAYNLSAYTTSQSGTRIPTPFTATIFIDRVAPEIELNYIEGSAGEDTEDNINWTIVNGVIKPRFLLSDSRPEDTGFRTGTTPYFERPSTSGSPVSYYSEQAYILIPRSDKAAMDTYLNSTSNLWPDFTKSLKNNLGNIPVAPEIPGVTVSKHGPIIYSACLFKTSHIFNDDSDTDSLPDGDYYLYAFARDNAFNVGRGKNASPSFPIPIRVKRSSDNPEFNFSIGVVETGVTEPDSAYDLGGKNYEDPPNEKSFIVAGNKVRNKFTANTSIQVKIKDDDSLDLGQNADPNDSRIVNEASGIKVWFIGSKPDATGVIQALDSDYLLELSDAEVKAAFPPQSVIINQDTNQPERIPVKEITGTISQTVLLNRLKAEPKYNYLFGIKTSNPPAADDTPAADYESIKAGFNSLPDGIYRVGMTIKDYRPAKLKMEAPYTVTPDTSDPDAVTVDVMNNVVLPVPPPITNYPAKDFFWIAVDSKNPEIEITDDTEPSGGIVSKDELAPLVGLVRDENGPITLINWRVILDGGTVSQMGKTVPANMPFIVIPDNSLTSNGFKDGKWEYKFSYKINMNGRDKGTFTFELQFQDRFGNKATVSLMYSVDNEPPKVSLTKPIETFSRDFNDVVLPNGDAIISENRQRLAVKVVNFSINAVDNFKVTGVRWWLLPSTLGAEAGGLTTLNGGQVTDYNAYPSATLKDVGTYYSTTNSTSLSDGAYGVVDVENRKFTIAIDSRKLKAPDGEYRLHIIAIDKAGNVSRAKEDDDKKPTSSVYQTVFFLQEEDKPYFGSDDNITPGIIVNKTTTDPKGQKWPAGADNMDVMGGNPIVRGTIFENNGFFGDGALDSFWPKTSGTTGSITIWFSKTESTGAKYEYADDDLPDNWETLVANGSAIPNYEMRQIPNDLNAGLGRQGRNISLAIELSALFPEAFNTDGKKRYIIKATDSPVNKLKDDGGPGTPMGVGNTSAEDEGVRVSRWRQFAFIYDAVPPEIIITAPDPEKDNKYGPDFASVDKNKGFWLEGSIEDKNLKTTSDGRYYFEYYLDSNTTPRYTFCLPKLTETVDGVTVTYNSDPPTKVTFSIRPDIVKARIIPNFLDDATKTVNGVTYSLKALTEGQHTLNLFAWDKSDKEGTAWVSFTKDMKPPTITFTNLSAANKPYNNLVPPEINASKVDNNWWTMTTEQRKTALLDNSPPLPLTTIYYDTGIPELRGTITDLVSEIDLGIKSDGTSATAGNTNTNVGSGDVNHSSSTFRYWIDKAPTFANGKPTNDSYLALIDGAGSRSVRWTILLTENGQTNGNKLCDGVHTIALTAADITGMTIPEAESILIAFRIDSKQPKSAATVVGTQTGVYGNSLYQNDTMFTVSLGAQDANLASVVLNIVRQGENTAAITQTFTPRSVPLNGTWAYIPYNATSLPTLPAIPTDFIPPLSARPDISSGLLSPKEDYVVFIGTFPVPKTLFDNVDSGKYDVKVVSYDTAGNKSEEYTWPFTYDKGAPKIEFTNPDKTSGLNATSTTLRPQDLIDGPTKADFDPLKTEFTITVNGKTETVRINRQTSENLRIQGNVSDDFSAIREVQSRVEKWNWEDTSAGTWTELQGWTDVKDYSTNTQLQVAWTKNLLGQNEGDLDLRTGAKAPPGGVALGTNLAAAEGLYRIRIRARDASQIPASAVSANWDDPVNSSVNNPPGAANLAGIGNPAFSDYVYFYFDRTNPTLEITKINNSDTAMSTYYSKPENGFTFEGTVEDNNRFAKVEVKFEIGTVGDAGYKVFTQPGKMYSNEAHTTEVPNINQGPAKQYWTAAFNNTTLQGASLPDGRYTVTVTVYDMTGRSNKAERKFILDSTPPTLKFTLPGKVKNKGYGDDSEDPKPAAAGANGFANADTLVILAGPTSVITGVTDDKPGKDGEKGSESGIDQMWFRLGYIDNITDNTNFPFPTKAAIEADEIALIREFSRVAGTTLTEAQVRAMPAKDRNEWMTKIAEYRASGATEAARNGDTRGNSWFKLGGIHKPTGFVINNPNIYDWRMEIPTKIEAMPTDADNLADYTDSGLALDTQIGGLKLYCNTITVKGRQYTVGSGARQMVRAIDGQPGGYYRLPLWVRLTDIAGNVAYYCHDIWIDANGSIPSTSIESPSNGRMETARGGAISVDGVAKSNTSVYDVIFRVFVDDVRDTNLDGIKTDGTPGDPGNNFPTTHTPPKVGGTNRPANGALLPITGYNTAETATMNKLPANYQPGGANGTNWQRANLTLPGGSGEPLIPWSIMLNSGDQIANLIGDKGFAASSGGTKDTIRVWLEVFVFNGEGSPNKCSIYPDDKLATGGSQAPGIYGGPLYGTDDTTTTGGAPGPRPYVKAFYIKTGAVKITHPNVGTWNGGTTATPTRHNNFDWNTESAQNPGDGGYRGAGQETRSKQFAISATLDPNPNGNSSSKLGEVSYRVKLNDGSYGTWNTVWKTGDTEITSTAPFYNNGIGISVRTTGTVTPARTRYWFDYAFDSKYIPGSGTPTAGHAALPNSQNWANTGGTITVQIRMRDNSSPPNEAEQTIQVGVDNFPPVADTNYRTNPKVAGTNVNFMGRVYDYANPRSPAQNGDFPDSMNTEYTPRKLARVSVWFTKGEGSALRYVNMNQKNTTTASNAVPNPRSDVSVAPVNTRTTAIAGGGANDSVTSITVTSRGGAADSFTYPGLGTQQAWNADYVRDITPATGQPVNKMLWAPVTSAVYDVRWSLTLDSTLLPDGDMTLHYIVVDDAGNASYYTQTGISVRNNYPEITRVTLYTDNNGQGAQYTMDDTIEYDLNNYRSKMFANYTDTADNAPNADGIRKTDTTGYLNSGFISKNKYIGFKVETTGGNRPQGLNFRLQHVKRTRVTLDDAALSQMVSTRAAGTAASINLYTIAWNGNYTPDKWRALGLPVNSNPTLGTHFVFNPSDEFKSSQSNYVGTAQVWKYEAVVTRDDILNPTVTGQTAASDPFVYGPSAAFEFKGDSHFNANAATNPNAANRINEYKGSHPDAGAGDVNMDDPGKTAFFLIRVWDSISTDATLTGEAKVNDQLYDALVVGMNVFLTDTMRPVARLYDLNPYTETTVQTTEAATIRNAANPQAIGSNIVRGGLFNAGTSRAMVRSGIIDPRGGSTALNPVNGVYDINGNLINGVKLPDYPLKVDSDAVGANARDKVSGRIILRGHAWDDQLIDTITLTLPNAPTSRTILQLTDGKMAATTAYKDTAFVVEELHWKSGHSVEWAYIWDTGTAPAENQTISVTVKDRNGNNQTSDPITVTQETANAAASKKYHNQVAVDIVPYITGFERKTPDFTTKRSLQGWYSFFRGETGIKVNGYNFGTGTATISLNGSTTGITVEGPVDTGKTQSTQRSFSIDNSNTINSGPITMTVSSVAAYNNTVDVAKATAKTNSQSWNREYNVFTPGSDLWTNRPYAHIWRSVQAEGTNAQTVEGAGTIFAIDKSSAGLDSPGMALQYTGTNAGLLHGSWTTYGRESLFYGQNINTKPTVTNETGLSNSTAGEGTYNPSPSRALLLLKAGEPYSDSDIDYYNPAGSSPNEYFNNTTVVATYQRDGEPYLVLKPRLTSVVFNSSGTDGGGGDTGYYVSRIDSPVTTYRWKSTRIKKAAVSIANNNPGRVFISSYDSINKRLFFKTVAGTLNAGGATSLGGAPPSLDENNGGTAMYLDGGGTLSGGIVNNNSYGTITTATGAGNWLAVDYTSDNYPVVAYFDEQNQTLRLAYANSNNPTTGAAWTRRYVLPVGDPLRLGSGSYVSMKIDRENSNRVHLAFYNSTNKAVVYATAPSPSGNFTATVIDRVVEGGQWTDISVDSSGNPWIVYADSSRIGGRDGARIAYRSYSGTGTAPAGAFGRELKDPVSGNMITGWEAMTMPANYLVNNDRLNIAAWPPSGIGAGAAATSPIGGWNAAVGYASDQYRIGYFFKPTLTGTGF